MTQCIFPLKNVTRVIASLKNVTERHFFLPQKRGLNTFTLQYGTQITFFPENHNWPFIPSETLLRGTFPQKRD